MADRPEIEEARRIIADARAAKLDYLEPVFTALEDLLGKQSERERALRQISDPSYVGNYPPEKVVEIYRRWATDALAPLPEQSEEEAC